MNDDHPAVRGIGVEGTCKVLALYWEVIPLEKSYAFLKRIVKKMAFDANSIAVRVSCFKGLTYLSDNHLAHPSLKSKFLI